MKKFESLICHPLFPDLPNFEIDCPLTFSRLYSLMSSLIDETSKLSFALTVCNVNESIYYSG